VTLPTDHPVVAWALRHAAWLSDRFQKGSDDLTPYYRQHQRNYHSTVLSFGEIVLWREPGPHKLKLKAKWGYGTWLGRAAASDSHVVGCRAGAMLVRGVRRLPLDGRHQVPELLATRGTPARMAHRELSDEAPAADAPLPAPPGLPQPPAVPEAPQPPPEAAPPPPPDMMEGVDVEDNEEAMVPAKRPRGRPPTRILPAPGSSAYTDGCPGCSGARYYHNAECRCRDFGVAPPPAAPAIGPAEGSMDLTALTKVKEGTSLDDDAVQDDWRGDEEFPHPHEPMH
jgi:hypothetical protein